MKDKTFLVLLFSVLAVGILVTAGFVVWAGVLRGNVSVITYIAQEVW